MGHFGSLGYYVAAFIGEKIGNPEDSTENIKIPEKLNFLRDTTISTGITMLVFYIVGAIVGAFVNGLFLSFLPALLLVIFIIVPSIVKKDVKVINAKDEY